MNDGIDSRKFTDIAACAKARNCITNEEEADFFLST